MCGKVHTPFASRFNIMRIMATTKRHVSKKLDRRASLHSL